MVKRNIILLLVVLSAFSIVSCGKNGANENTEVKKTEAEESQIEETEVVVETPGNINLLTGLSTLTDEAVGKRPVAVMVNNVKAAFPQYGIAQADIIFEMPVEGGATRFMAMYGDYTKVPKICSVRSCRGYFPEISEGFDAVYVNWGMSEDIRPYVNSLNLTHYEGAYNTGNLFARDSERQAAGYALEHTGYFDGTGLPQAMKDAEQRTDIEDDKKDTAFKFNSADTIVKPVGDACTTVTVDYGVAEATLTYDAESNTYLKQYNGDAQIDGVTGTQLAFTNVLILECNIGIHSNGVHKDIKWNEGGNGYYVSNGAMQQITWSKDSVESRIMLFDEDGNELKINAGKSYIGISFIGESSFE